MRKHDDEFESGQMNSSSGNFPDRQMEADPGVFEDGQPNMLDTPDRHPDVPDDQLDRYGDSRPDRLDSGGFDDITEDPRMTTMRDGEHEPEIHKEDPEFLAEHRVDQEDEIVGRPAGEFNEKEVAVLRPRISKKGDESEGI